MTVNISDSNSESGGHAQGDTLTGMANLLGSAHADTLTGSDDANHIEGGPGNDTLNGGGAVDRFYFYPGFGNDTINGHENTDFFYVCIDGAAIARDRNNSRTKITVTGPDGNVTGTFSVTGNWTEAQVVVFVGFENEGFCQSWRQPEGRTTPKLRVWWDGNTPQMVQVGTTRRLFVRSDTNLNAAAVCHLAGLDITGTDPSSLNCPPTTLTSLSPVGGNDGDTGTVHIVATGADGSSVSGAYQTFHRGGHSLPPMATAASDGRIRVTWTTGNPTVSGTTVNGHQVSYRPLGESGSWISSNVLASTTSSHTLIGLTNGTTYEVRVRTRNDAADTDTSTHWWSAWDYDTATPQASD